MTQNQELSTLGDRIGRLRRPRGLTQEQLAEVAGVSVETIRKLERNDRTTARVETMNKLARALGVPTSALHGDSAEATVRREAGDDDELGLIELRRVLTPARGIGGLVIAEDFAGPITVDTVTRAVRYADALYHHDEYAAVLRALPQLLTDARHLIRDVAGDDQAVAYGLLSGAYRMAGKTLLQLRRLDLAHIALSASLDAAERSSDPSRVGAMAVRSMLWLLTRQARFGDASQLAIATADAIEPRFSRATPVALANWGWLLLYGSAAAARDARPDDAREQLDAAEAGAVRLGQLSMPEWDDVEMGGFSLAKVGYMRTEAAVVAGEPGKALEIAARIEPSTVPTPSCRHRHQLDVASAHLQKGTAADNSAAGEVLLGLGRTAPTWLRNQRLAGDLVGQLAATRRRAMGEDLAQLTALVGADHL
ncbi:helix-turn-helix domain-containing protein [Actinoplanes derwentensis]|uniref:Transcriptional regulator, contains XRE-family HTH domain n=1 Tax=Actinoplanes derwentensis TaxID=113562 RepID=A0A1H1ZPB0_9ACTN|nr:helix-turn-helix domain-containing protein [Actinoplanes derwentensis]SDT35066.1 Transcriptional regulator, contains XRE-family HTH domain [Actinoplanes derwentensis]